MTSSPTSIGSPIEEHTKLSAVETFFGFTWTKMIYSNRKKILLMIAALMGYSIWRAMQVSPLTKTEIYLPDSIPIE